MRSFKEQMEKDLRTILNPVEFGVMSEVRYGGRCYTVPVVIDEESAQERKRMADDHAEGINRIETTIFISLADIGTVPENGCIIEIGQAGWTKMYEIVHSECICGMIELGVEAYDE